MIDLGAWAMQQYRVSGPDQESDEGDKPGQETE